MTKTQREVLIALLFSTAALCLVAAGFHISKFPEEEFVHRMRTDQMEFDEYQTFEEAVLALQVKEESFLLEEVTLTSERGNITAAMQNLGAETASADVHQYLLNFMEDASGLTKVRVYLFGKKLDYELTVNEDELKTAFATSGIEQGVKNAEFTSTNGTVSVAPEQVGYGIDTEALTEQLKGYWTNDFTVPESDELPLRTREPEIRTAELEPFVAKAQIHAARTFTLEDKTGKSWEIKMADHVDWLIPGAQDELQIDDEAFIAYAELDLVPEVESDPQPVTIIDNGDGTYDFEGSARFGREIDKEALLTSIESALATGEDTAIPMPITEIQPAITVPESLRAKGVTDLLGFGYSGYSGSPANRIHNVNTGIEKFNGVLLEKDAEFSFTTLMGDVDAAHGWLPELVIKGDETIPEYGGGLCQVSSTMFRAALYTGLPITMRRNHSYAVSYYAYPEGYGLDATIYDPLPDLRFKNDTQGAILIQGYTVGSEAYFVFYGTNDGRSVKMEGPYAYDYTSAGNKTTYTDKLAEGERQLVEYGHTGFKVDWYRTIFYADGTESEREQIHSDYEARPAQYWQGGSDPSAGTETTAAL